MHNCQKRGTVVFFRSFKILQVIKSIHYQKWHRRFSYLNIFFRFWTPVLYKIYTYKFFTNKNEKKKEKSLDNGQD